MRTLLVFLMGLGTGVVFEHVTSTMKPELSVWENLRGLAVKTSIIEQPVEVYVPKESPKETPIEEPDIGQAPKLVRSPTLLSWYYDRAEDEFYDDDTMIPKETVANVLGAYEKPWPLGTSYWYNSDNGAMIAIDAFGSVDEDDEHGSNSKTKSGV